MTTEEDFITHQKRGRKGKASGLDFEKRTRAHLESFGWIVSKFPNKPVDGKLVAAKNMFRGPGIPMAMGTGFPDFIAYKPIYLEGVLVYQVIFVECKVAKYLSETEREMARWYLANKYCSAFHVAYRTKEKNKIKVNLLNYKDVKNG